MSGGPGRWLLCHGGMAEAWEALWSGDEPAAISWYKKLLDKPDRTENGHRSTRQTNEATT